MLCSFPPSLNLLAVVVSLLINLVSPVSEVRRAALNCLHSLRGIKESLFHPVLQHLEQKTEEIVSDPTYVAQVFFKLSFVCCCELLSHREEIKLTRKVIDFVSYSGLIYNFFRNYENIQVIYYMQRAENLRGINSGLFPDEKLCLYLNFSVMKASNNCCFKAFLLQENNLIFTLLMN